MQWASSVHGGGTRFSSRVATAVDMGWYQWSMCCDLQRCTWWLPGFLRTGERDAGGTVTVAASHMRACTHTHTTQRARVTNPCCPSPLWLRQMSKNGKYLLTSGRDSTAVLWDIRVGKLGVHSGSVRRPPFFASTGRTCSAQAQHALVPGRVVTTYEGAAQKNHRLQARFSHDEVRRRC